MAEVEHEIDRGRDVFRDAPGCRRRVGGLSTTREGALGWGWRRDVFHVHRWRRPPLSQRTQT
jgi:hypothetical protein